MFSSTAAREPDLRSGKRGQRSTKNSRSKPKLAETESEMRPPTNANRPPIYPRLPNQRRSAVGYAGRITDLDSGNALFDLEDESGWEK